MNEASLDQIRAATPDRSTWLSANAGSGKTRVLTDRVARLLLRDTAPQNILCLTFTKAAAAEMQNRLFARLGEWAMLPDDKLRSELETIGEGAALDERKLLKARRLFARAIEAPGGLKIQTIHSFCSSILRRFPLEAGVPPGFTELDETAAQARLSEALDRVATEQADTFEAFASLFSGQDLAKFCMRLGDWAEAYGVPPNVNAILKETGLPPDYSQDRLIGETFLGGEDALIATVLPFLNAGGATDCKVAAKLNALPAAPMARLEAMEGAFLIASGANAGRANISRHPTKGVQAAMPGEVLAQYHNLMSRVEAAQNKRKALLLAQRSVALHQFAHAFLPRYEAAKAARGELDFDDLIIKTRDLLTRPGVAEWVLYRLDGGIDHILVDEAQDTSPEQWQVIELLTREITAGSGTREAGERTIFVVGDKKQSIYGFQGADPDGFERMAEEFRRRLAQIGAPLNQMELKYSFRSAGPILRVVDMAFPDAQAAMGGALGHIAFHAAMPGRVDLWPFFEKEKGDEGEGDWTDPIDMLSNQDPKVLLADEIAQEIARIKADECLFSMKGGEAVPRKPTDGDFLVLVQSRTGIFSEVIRACKQRGLDVAGADRVKLTEALAVKDVLAVLQFLATPEDDLALACALRSPIFGWSEDALFRLAANRPGLLWPALRDAAWADPEARDTLSTLLDITDFQRPFELIDQLLRRYEGRPRLIARLGAEAEDQLDLLLSTALNYEQNATPSLTGFLAWLEESDIEIKRSSEAGGRAIRVMTVHGAKGLESPIVILAETGERNPPRDKGPVQLREDGAVLWEANKDATPNEVAEKLAEIRAKEDEERHRLHYVAMTRAEQWLILCGAGKAGEDKENWYRRTEQAMERAGAVDHSFAAGVGKRVESWPEGPLKAEAEDRPSAAAVAIPEAARRPAPSTARPPQILLPSSLSGAKTLPGEAAGDPDAMERGTAIHMLLEELVPIAPTERPARGATMLKALFPNVDASVLAEALAVLETPEFAPLFAANTMAEVAITAQLNGRPIQGVIDRLIITPEVVTAVDYKSNQVLPSCPEEAPVGLLAQLGAYATALSQVYPGREIRTALLWTKGPRLDLMPHDLVMRALDATASA